MPDLEGPLAIIESSCSYENGAHTNYRLIGGSESVSLVWVQESLFLTNVSDEFDEQLGLKNQTTQNP